MCRSNKGIKRYKIYKKRVENGFKVNRKKRAGKSKMGRQKVKGCMCVSPESGVCPVALSH